MTPAIEGLRRRTEAWFAAGADHARRPEITLQDGGEWLASIDWSANDARLRLGRRVCDSATAVAIAWFILETIEETKRE